VAGFLNAIRVCASRSSRATRELGTFLLWRMDEHYEWLGDVSARGLSKEPSESFKRQCLVFVERDEEPIKGVFDLMGVKNVVLSTDFPHPDCKYRALSSGFSSSRCPTRQSARSFGAIVRGTMAFRDQRPVRGWVSRSIRPSSSGNYS